MTDLISTNTQERRKPQRIGPSLRAIAVTMREFTLRHRATTCAICMVPVLLLTFLTAVLIRFDGTIPPAQWALFRIFAVSIVPLKLLLFHRFNVLRGWSRYVTFHDLTSLAAASGLAFLTVIAASWLVQSSLPLPRSVLCLDLVLTICIVGSLRSVSRFIGERERSGRQRHELQRALIAGDSNSAELLIRALRRQQQAGYRVIGVLTPDSAAVGRRICGVPVLGEIQSVFTVAAREGVSEVLIASGDLPGNVVRTLNNEGKHRSISIKIVPCYAQLLRQDIEIRPREVSIEDLLQRDPVQLDMDRLHTWIDDRVILVTGSAGSIGSEVCRQLLRFRPRRLVLVDRWENGQFYLERELQELDSPCEMKHVIADLNDRDRMNAIFSEEHPDVVFHAAAFKHVPLMESNPGEAIKNIVLTSRILADLSHLHQVDSFVMISTDKAVNPTNVMGACKRIAEMYVQGLASTSQSRFVTVRFGNVLGSNGSVVPIFRDQIAKGGPVTVTHPEIQRYFMTIPEASQLVIQAGAMGKGGEIFVLDMGRPVRIVDLAEDLIRLSGLQPRQDIEIEFSGLRPGEKLFEELNAAGETHVATDHHKIRVATSAPSDLQDMDKKIRALADACNANGRVIRQAIHRIVPEYQLPENLREPARRAA